MKSILILFILFGISAKAGEQIEVKSKIKSVVVYQQGAQIKREGRFSVKKGIQEIKISGISAQIDPNTLQIKANGNLIIIDSKYNVRYPEPIPQDQIKNEIPPKIKKEIRFLKDSIFDLTYSEMEIQNKMDVLNSQKRIIENNGTIKGQGKVNDSIELLQNALIFYQKEMNAINASLLKLIKKQTLLLKRKNRMNSRLSELLNYNRNNPTVVHPNNDPIHEIIITISAKEATNGKIEVTYLVSGAGWIPLYDLRSTDKSKTINLTYKAQVYQNTGINWENTRLSLSTNNPYANKTKPFLSPWFLDYYSYNNTNNELDNVSSRGRADLKDKKQSRSIAYSNAPAMEDTEDLVLEKALTADQFMTTVEQLISVEYSIDLPYSIKSDNKKNLVLIKTMDLNTNYVYYTVPKLDPSVYLVAQITDLDELNLVPGNATIFHEGSYLGTTYINPNSLKDTMDLSLGKTSNITVKRHLLKNATKEKIVGDKIIKTYAYSIEVRNLGRNSIELIIEDQIPVSRNPEIEIELENKGKGNFNEINGFISWKDKIKAGGLAKYEFVYTIKYEKTMSLNLANL